MAFVDSAKNPHVPVGPQDPAKYGGRVGDNYLHYGEQPGYIYNSADDSYYVDQNAARDYAKQTGQYRPQPGLLAQIAPLAAAAGGIGLAQSLGKDPGGFLSGLMGLGKGLFGSSGGGGGSAASTAGTYGASGLGDGTLGSLTIPAASGAPAAPTGLALGAGGDAASADTAGAGSGLFSLGGTPALAALAATYLGGHSILDELAGRKNNSLMGDLGRGTADIATGGLAEIPRALGVGNGPDYFAGQDRQNALDDLTGGTGSLSLPESGGGMFSLNARDFAKDPSTYDVGANTTPQQVSQANSILGINSSNDASAPTLTHQLAGAFANALQAGVNPDDLTKSLSSLQGTNPGSSVLSLLGLAQGDNSSSKIDPMALLNQSQNG